MHKHLVGVDEIVQITKLVLLSGYVLDEAPLSMMLISRVEAGKSQILEQFRENHGVLWMSDFTAFGLMQHHGAALAAGKYRSIMVPDFIRVLSHKHETREATLSFLLGLIEEGNATVSVGPQHFTIKTPYRCGFVTAIPRDLFLEDLPRWKKIGLFSRLLPVSWDYPPSIVRQIFNYVFERSYQQPEQVRLGEPDGQWPVYMTAEQARQLHPLAMRMAQSDASRMFGFRFQRHFQRLAMASALERGNSEVDQQDIDRIMHLARYINLDFKQVTSE